MKRRNIVGGNIRKYRTEAGITQEELALRSGLSQGYINQLEYGNRKYTQKSLELIATALSKKVIEFFKDETSEIPEHMAEYSAKYKDINEYKKEFTALLSDLPAAVIDHYLTLMKIENDLMHSDRRPNR